MIKFENGFYKHGEFSLDISIEIAEEEFFAVLGPSGAGKSTLLNIIAGFEKLASGRLYVGGEDLTLAQPSARPISMVFQDHNVFAHLNVRENVSLGINPNLNLSRAQLTIVETALDRVGLGHYGARLPGELSGGERQRVALARVLVRQSKILLLDEPFAALDPGLRHEMLKLVQDITTERKLTTLMVTHQPDEAKRVAQSIIFISNGIVEKPQITADFFRQSSDAVAKYLGQQN